MKHVHLLAGLLVSAIAMTANAQNPTPGLAPAFTSNAPVEVTKEREDPLARPALAEPTADQTAQAEALLRLVQNTSVPGAPVKPAKPPPPDITVKPGVTEHISVALGTLNRLQTPFADPVVTHGESLAVQRQDSVLYLSTNDPSPAALFITPRGDPTQAIALTVTPSQGLDPVTVRLHLAGYEAKPVLTSPGDATGFETSQPYVETLKEIFRSLAMGQIPQGYGFTEIRGGSTPWMPTCPMRGIRITPRQLLDGGNLVTIVARAVNTSIDTTEIEEDACEAPGVLAVAAWPRVRLEPGEETELYIAVRRPDPGADGMRRPSALNAGG